MKDKAELDFTYDFYTKEVLAPGPIQQAEEVQARLKTNIDAIGVKNPKVKSLNAAQMIDKSFVKKADKHRT